ncbi:SDR family NAD(P)-dependent oxidoreductase [Amycolatopsis speibonae]|uniref:SDR family NAD(P)-dependent oxidoreductase n=1 Tax=Amycolatopsis speibonae TaxID=1450224 RepID=A0ABV7PB22_9PSEU
MPEDQKLGAYLRRVTAELFETRARLREAEGRQHEPIAIVGVGCRYPGGVTSPEDLWELVSAGRDAISDFPDDRGWDTSRTSSRGGGFLHDSASFDPELFGISPREALATDPQQRLMLEVAWEALERTGIDPHSLRGSNTGVFTGVGHSDYGARYLASGADGGELEGYLGSGSAHSVVCGRISYTFGLHGPSVTVDTACSSSLVAMHWAMRSLRSGECDLALAGGVTVMSTPAIFVEFSRQGALSADGRCKSFAKAADGTGWSEGAALLVLQRLSQAQEQGRHIWGVLRGSAVNQDGASNGLTAPSGPAQERVIRSAWADATVPGDTVDVVEAHGTGTRLGDPIEAQALLATYGQGRDEPVLLGSVKSNIGHTQAAAGVAGVIKMVMAIRHGVVPASLHVDEPTPEVDWEAGAVRVADRTVPWPHTGHPRRAGVSSFGVGGTNAHVIVEQAPEADTTTASQVPGTALVPWIISGTSPQAVRAQAGRLLGALALQRDWSVAEVGRSLLDTRATLGCRSVVPAAEADEALRGLEALVAGSVDVVPAGTTKPGLGFVFSGQGSQRLSMGRELAEAFPVFAEAFGEVCALMAELGGTPGLRDVVWGDDASTLDRTPHAQAGLFAFQVALVRLLDSWGIRPDHVMGHSLGEVTAAYVAGVWSLPDACRVVGARGWWMNRAPGGAMASIKASVAEVEELLTGTSLTIAAVNGPSSVVVSGPVGEVGALVESGARVRRLRVSHAFHSPSMDSVLAGFQDDIREVVFHSPQIPVITGGDAGRLTEPSYWAGHIRATVQFGRCVEEMLGTGAGQVLEIGPDGTLTSLVAAAVEDGQQAVAAMRARRPEPEELLSAVARLFAHGTPVDWRSWFSGDPARTVDLPTYAFQRRRYWLDAPKAASSSSAVGLEPGDHPLLFARLETGEEGVTVFAGRWSPDDQSWIDDHRVANRTVVPGTTFVELALHVGRVTGFPFVQELVHHVPLALDRPAAMRLRLEPASADGRRGLSVLARFTDHEPWVCHTTGTMSRLPEGPASDRFAFAAAQWPPPDTQELDLAGLYTEDARAVGFDYGPTFRGVTAAWFRGRDLYLEITPPERLVTSGYGLHPALLDAVFHPGLLARGPIAVSEPLLPFAWSDVRLHQSGATSLRVHVAWHDDRLSITVADDEGDPVLGVGSLVPRPHDLTRTASRAATSLYRLRWMGVQDELPMTSCTWYPPAADPFGLAPHLAEAGSAGRGPAVHLLCVEGGADPGACTVDTLHAVRQWLNTTEDPSARLLVVTKGAVAADGPARDLAAAAARGLLRSAQTENPGRITLLDLDDGTGVVRALRFAATTAEPEVTLRAGRLLVPRLATTPPAPPNEVDPSGTFLITGGTGALGGVLARHLVATHGVRSLVLASRRGTGAAGLREELEALGAKVTFVRCDVSDAVALAGLIEALPSDQPLRGVFHLAGVTADSTIDAMSEDHVRRVLKSKVDGARNLHDITKAHDLSAFVMFSSVSALVGAPGQGNYAAANAFLNALATHRQSLGLPAQSLAWGLWAEQSEMTTKLAGTDRTRLARAGICPLGNDEGMDLLDAAIADGGAVLAPVSLDVTALPADVPLFRALTSARPRPSVVTAEPEGSDELRRLTALSGEQRRVAVTDLVRGLAASVLGHADASEITGTVSFRELGFDSMVSVDLRNRLNRATGFRFPATVAFDHPNVEALASHLMSKIGGNAGAHDTTLAALVGQVVRAGRAAEALQLIGTAGSVRSMFGADRPPVEPTELVKSGGAPQVVCLPPLGARSGVQDYYRLADALGPAVSVSALALPGFQQGEELPDSLEALVAGTAAAVRGKAGGSVLIGHSSGGWLTHLVAEHLEREGSPAAGVVLLDTYLPGSDEINAILPELLHDMLEGPDSAAAVGQDRLTAMGWYFRLFADWTPNALSAPTLFIRPSDPLREAHRSSGWRANWPLPHENVEVAGDHFTMMTTHAADTAATVSTWIKDLKGARVLHS